MSYKKTTFFLTKPSRIFEFTYYTRATKLLKDTRRKSSKTTTALCCKKERVVAAKSTNAMAAAKRSAKSAKTKKPSPLTSTNAKISAFLSDYVATSNGNAFASGLKLLVKKTSSKKKNKADARDVNDDQNFFLDGKRVLGLSDAIAKVRFPRLRGRDGVSPRGLRRSVFSSFFSNGVCFEKRGETKILTPLKTAYKFFSWIPTGAGRSRRRRHREQRRSTERERVFVPR